MFNYRESRLTSITVNIRHLRIEKEKRKTKSYRISLRARLGFQVEAHNVAELTALDVSLRVVSGVRFKAMHSKIVYILRLFE